MLGTQRKLKVGLFWKTKKAVKREEVPFRPAPELILDFLYILLIIGWEEIKAETISK